MKRSVLILLLLSLLLPLWSLPTRAAEDAPLEDGDFDYTYSYDEEDGVVSVRMTMRLAAESTYDFRKLFRDAADKNATVDIDLSTVKLYFSRDAVRALSGSGLPLVLTVKDTSDYPEKDEEDPKAETEKPSEYRYTVSMGGVPFPEQSVRIRIRYTPKRSDMVRVTVTDEDGTSHDLISSCKDRFVSFYPVSFTEFTITEAPLERGFPKIVILLAGALGALVVASIGGVVYLKKRKNAGAPAVQL